MVYHFSVRLLLCFVFEVTEYEFCEITPSGGEKNTFGSKPTVE